jgi:hypothetical protein
MLSKHTIILAAVLVAFARSAWPQGTNATAAQSVATDSGPSNDTNAANNPVDPQLTIDLQNYFVPSPEGYSGRIGAQGLLRVSVPIDEFGLHQFVRVILPIDTTATEQGGPNTGVGDLTVYDLVLFQAHGTTIGAGPLVAAPTARGFAYGSGKWQAGAAGIVLKPFGWGLLGVLVNYEHTFSGNNSGPVGQEMTVQPIIHYNFHHGFYFRSTGVWTFNSYYHVQDIPLGLGVGKVWRRSNGDLVNLYIEPQYSVYQSGVLSPKWQIFAGATFKFPIGKRPTER